MDNLGSQVCQKMRSAVKAKLIELGTGGAAGYIDDELPDYVMIMVANKRSKQQMISDLNLFLGSHTELFVTWLHEVLQKLQEVTLPAAAISKSKRKASGTDNSISVKKERKDKKKDKKSKKPSEKSEEIAPSSISDVFAGHLLEKAKKPVEPIIKAKKENTPPQQQDSSASSSLAKRATADEFDIPTITEIAEKSSERQQEERQRLLSREKDLRELAEIQKKIYEAKRHLRGLESDESEDEDFLNIKEDGEEFEEDVRGITGGEKINNKKLQPDKDLPLVDKDEDVYRDKNEQSQTENSTSKETKKHTPITFGKEDKVIPRETRERSYSPPKIREREEETKEQPKKRSIHERLGFKSSLPKNTENIISLSKHRRSEKELYVPSYRRRSVERREPPSRRPHVGKHNSKASHESEHSDTDRDSKKNDKLNIRRRIGSRVIVAPPKPEIIEEEDDAEEFDKPISSQIRIKPRPAISPSRQASKNLLLKAVAEAQKSTALVKPKKDFAKRTESPPVAVTQSSLPSSRIQKLYTKSYRDRNRKALLNRATKDNIVIEVDATQKNYSSSNNSRFPSKLIINKLAQDVVHIDEDDNDEYVPEPISDRGDSDNDYVYIPQVINSGKSDEEYENSANNLDDNSNKTQFVVTLDGYPFSEKFGSISKYKPRITERTASLKVSNEHNSINEINISQRSSGNHKSRDPERYENEENRSKMKNDGEINVDKRKLDTKKWSEEKEFPSQKSFTHHYSDRQHSSSTERLKRTALHSRHKSVNEKIDKSEGIAGQTKETTKKLIIKNSSEDESASSLSPVKRKIDERSTTPPLPPNLSTQNMKRKRNAVSPIKFDLNEKKTVHINENEENHHRDKNHEEDDYHKISYDNKRRSLSNDRDGNHDKELENKKVSIKKFEVSKKYDNIPDLLSAVPVDALTLKTKTKERCKYYPSCGKGDSCEFYHPTLPCKAFPNCKFVDKCLYIHPKCKFDLTCNRVGCNFSHSSSNTTPVNTAPPLSSHVVPVQNYKTITANPLPALCKYYPNCTNTVCNFYHPKPCRFGKNCMNKIECNFYHHDLPNKGKFKWVASLS